MVNNLYNIVFLCVQLANRKQFIEYKLKLATRASADGTSAAAGVSAADRAALIAELTEVQANSEALIRQYERRFGESYAKLGGEGAGPGPSAVYVASTPGSVSWESGGTGGQLQSNPSPRTAAAGSGGGGGGTPFSNNMPSARHSITLPSTASAAVPSYMSPLAKNNSTAAATASPTAAANKSAFKSIPPVR